tara:strand:+ start:359 stop:550 length:192 start_codon:yes stop_codon:yes gene_type:complete
MTKVNIDNKEYEFDELSDKIKATLVSLNFVQTELKKLSAQEAVYKTAEVAYQKSLKQELDSKD